MSSLFATLPAGPLDIVGDVHGELDALLALMGHLGYAADGAHPDGRTLVFVGDLCDRGPDSPGVWALARRLVASGRAVATLGNHELNLLRGDRKDGNDWFFGEFTARDARYMCPPATGSSCRPCSRAPSQLLQRQTGPRSASPRSPTTATCSPNSRRSSHGSRLRTPHPTASP